MVIWAESSERSLAPYSARASPPLFFNDTFTNIPICFYHRKIGRGVNLVPGRSQNFLDVIIKRHINEFVHKKTPLEDVSTVAKSLFNRNIQNR